MGDAADDLTESIEYTYEAHYAGLCDVGCPICFYGVTFALTGERLTMPKPAVPPKPKILHFRPDIMKELRLKLGMTQKSLSETIGIAENTIARYERSEIRPGIDMLFKLAKVLKTTVNKLIGEK